jgi:hypothetical protein
MKRQQVFTFQLRPDGQQECQMRRFVGGNRAIALQNENHEEGNKYIPDTAYQKNQDKRAKPQSQLSRRVKFSNNW